MKKFISIFTLSLILFTGIMLSGCKQPENILLSLSTEKIEMLINEQPEQYSIAVENYDKDVNFDFEFADNFAVVLSNSVENAGDGRYTFTITPLTSGTTTLKITLRGTGKYVEVPVIISEELQKIEIEHELFVKKGESLVLENSLFKFTPETTILNEITISLKDGQELDTEIHFNQQTNTLIVGELTTAKEVEFVAVSTSDSTKSCEFVVKIVDKIDVSKLSVHTKHRYNENTGLFDNETIKQVYGYDEQMAVLVNENITLIRNNTAEFLKQILVEYSSAEEEFGIDVYASDGIFGDISSSNPIINKTQNFTFNIQSSQTSAKDQPFELEFRIYKLNFPSYFEKVTLDVYAVNTPNEIRVNNKKSLDVVELYHNSGMPTEFRFSVYPSLNNTQNEENYIYSLSVYLTDENKVKDNSPCALTRLNQYMTITYGSVDLQELTTYSYALVDSLNDLSSVLKIIPNKEYAGYFAIVVNCIDNTTQTKDVVVTNTIYVKIFRGTTKFEFNENYADETNSGLATLYVKMPNEISNDAGIQTFQGFSYDGDSTIGDLKITPLKASQQVCTIIEDKTSDVVSIKIIPLNVGEEVFTIQIENGKYVTLTVIVFREIEETDFAIHIKDSPKNSIASFKYKDAGINGLKQKTLDNVTIKGIGQTVQLTESIYQYTDTNEYSYAYSIVVTGNECFNLLEDNKLISTTFTDESSSSQVSIKLSYNTVEAFKLKMNEVYVCNFTVGVCNYIKNMNISVSDGSADVKKTKSISVYNKNDLSYINQNLAEAYVYLHLEKSDISTNLLAGERFTINANISVERQADNIYQLGNVGYLYLTQYTNTNASVNGEDYIAKFVCDVTGFNTTDSFTLTLKVTDDIGAVFESTITIKIEEYIDVTSIYLATAADMLYLDATDKNKSVSIATYVLPTNALCKDVQVFIETADAGCLTYTQDINKDGNTKLTFTYYSGGSGYIRIFPVSNMKTGSPKDEYGNYYYHIALYFTCADGSSEDKALKLSTYQDLVNINASLYYFIDTLIDCGGKELYIPAFSGYIRGTMARVPDERLNDSTSANYSPEEYKAQVDLFKTSPQIGGITNFIIKNRGVNSGLIGNLTGKLENLTISGSFANNQADLEIKKEQEALYLGILCGTNNGSIINVQVSAANTEEVKITNKSEKIANTLVLVGIVAGLNNGTIEVNNNAKISTLMVQSINQLQLRVAHTEIDDGLSKKCYPVTSYIGGVAGQNSPTGTIVNNYEDDMVLVGLFGITVNVNVVAITTSINTTKGFEGTNYGYLGGVVGQNLGNVTNIKAIGYVENNYVSNSHSAVGGLIGIYQYNDTASIVSGNTSRVYVRGRGTVSGLIGNFSLTTDFSKIINNTVQATDSGKMGVDASLIVKLVADPSAEYIFAISPETLDESNVTETYIDRSVATQYVTNLDVEFYYGDLIIFYNYEIRHKEIFTFKSDEEIVIKAKEFALAVYKQALDVENQTYIDNTISTANILMYVAGVRNCEVLIEVDKNSLASIINFGKDLSINSTGLLALTLQSALNYKNSQSIKIYLTNYFEEAKAYKDKNRQISTDVINIINSKTSSVYMGCSSDKYNYKNTLLSLAGNTEVGFECKETGDLLETVVSGQTIYLTAKQMADNQTKISLTAYLAIDNLQYYATYNDYVNCFVFYKNFNLDLDNDGTDDTINKVVSEISVEVVTGIENINIGKANVLAEPSNEIEFNVYYQTYNINDYLNVSGEINDVEYTFKWEDEDKSLGYFIDGSLNNIFKLERMGRITEDINITDTYLFTMVISENNYLNYRNSYVYLTFTSNNTGEHDSIAISYTPETITAVLLNNYSGEENNTMINESTSNVTYNENGLLTTGQYTSTGDYNILKAYVYTRLSEFDYVDVVLNTNINGGYLAIGKDGGINRDVIYTSINGALNLRVYKTQLLTNAEIYDGESRLLEIIILYSIPANTADGTKIPITLTFYKKDGDINKVCYQESAYVIAKAAKGVEFTIYGEEKSEPSSYDFNQSYRLVKGKKYALELNVVGYKENEIVFESSAPNIANITYESGVYYLNITNVNIDYQDQEYFGVTILAYGNKFTNGNFVKSRVQKTELKIYEFILNENIFNTDKLNLRVLTSVDLRETILKEVGLNYSSYNKHVKAFENEFKENSIFKVISNGVTIELSDSTKVTTANYELNGFNMEPIVVYAEAPYKISISYEVCYKNGKPTCDIEDATKIYSGTKTFTIQTYISTTEQLAAPVYNYEDLNAMQDGEYYRQVSDITISAQNFEMLSAKPAMFDGNGHKIIITGSTIGSALTNIGHFALFENISAGSIFKNINVVLSGAKTIQIDNNYATSGILAGILTSQNDGIITNCSIKSDEILTFNVLSTVALMEMSYFGTICAVNNGFITNCRVEANVTVGGASIGGLVCNNNGTIVSSIVKNSRIANTSAQSNENISTGGFVCNNAGKISMSYIEGKQSAGKIYSDYSANEYGLGSKIIYTSSAVGGFVFQNDGSILDCYANIPIVSSSRCAGFVAFNNGQIENVFSLSKMKRNDTLNYAFVISHNDLSEQCYFKNCYFVLEEDIINDFTSQSNYIQQGDSYVGVIKGVEPLSIEQFNLADTNGNKKINTPFASFVTGNKQDDISGIWFYTYDGAKNKDLASPMLTYLTSPSEFNYYDVSNKEVVSQSFSAGHLQLVSPNLIATQNLTLRAQSNDYTYEEKDNNILQGSKYNPYLIASAEDFEKYCNQKGSAVEYYRLICDINYESENIYNSKLTTKKLMAYFEGNNFEIANYNVNNNQGAVSAGLIGQFGNSNSPTSTMKNITFKPKYINLPNSIYVGGVAGVAFNAKIYNVNVIAEDVIMVGKNMVGGLFGRVDGETYLTDVYANIITKSSMYGSGLVTSKNETEVLIEGLNYKETGANRSAVSYSGGIVGFVGGTSYVNNAAIGEKTKVLGATAGLLFGGIGSYANVYNLDVTINSYDNQIKAYAFGGIIAGENKGTINGVQINSNILNKTLFSCYPITPVAIGGVAGLMLGGKIENISSSKGYNVIGADFTNNSSLIDGMVSFNINNPYVAQYVGGLVGYMKGGKINGFNNITNLTHDTFNNEYLTYKKIESISHEGSNIYVQMNEGPIKLNKVASIVVSGGNYVGGVVGYATSVESIENINVMLSGHKQYINKDGNEIDEMVYMSYVSEFGNVNSFNDVNYVGTIAGFANAVKFVNIAISAENNLYTYYAKFNNTDSALTSIYMAGNIKDYTALSNVKRSVINLSP